MIQVMPTRTFVATLALHCVSMLVHEPFLFLSLHCRYFRRAFVFKSLGDFEKAAKDFEHAKQLDPGNPDLVVNYRTIHDT